MLFYIYLIEKWTGEFPKYIIEEDETDSVIKFFRFEEARSLTKYEGIREALDMIESNS